MKKILFNILTLASAAIFACACTDYSEDFNALQGEYDNISGNTLPTIQNQIKSIDTSLNDYQTVAASLGTYVNVYNDRLAALEASLGVVKSKADSLLADMTQAQKDSAASAYASILSYYSSVMAESKQKCSEPLDSLVKLMGDLDKQMAAAKTYADSLDTATISWASATFVTVEHYDTLTTLVSKIKSLLETTPDDISALEARIDKMIGEDLQTSIDTLGASYAEDVEDLRAYYTQGMSYFEDGIESAYKKVLSEDIASFRSSLNSWLGEKFAEYPKGADTQAIISHKRDSINAILAAQDEYISRLVKRLTPYTGNVTDSLSNYITSLDNARKEIEATAKTTRNESAALLEAIDTARAQLKAGWEKALSEAADAVTPKLEAQIVADMDSVLVNYTSEISALSSRAKALDASITELESSVSSLEARALDVLGRYDSVNKYYEALKARVQSATMLAQHSDGSFDVVVTQSDATLTLTVEVQEEALASQIAYAWNSGSKVLAVRALTTMMTKSSASDYVTLKITSVTGSSDGTMKIVADASALSSGFFGGTSGANGVIDFCDADGTPYLSTTYFKLNAVRK